MDDDIEKTKAALVKSLLSEDELGMVVRVHILVESRLNEFIELHLKKPEKLKKIDLDYEATCKLAIALGLSEEVAKPLACLGTIRNKFAHDHEYKFSKDTIENFYNCFSARSRDYINKTYNGLKKAKTLPKTFRALDPESKFIVCAIDLHSSVHAAVVNKRPSNLLI